MSRVPAERARIRRPRGRRGPSVFNPLSGHNIRIGGTRFRQLTQPGPARVFTYNRAQNRLDFVVEDAPVLIEQIYSPSEGEEPINRLYALAVDQRVQELLRERISAGDQVRGNWTRRLREAMQDVDPFYGQWARLLSWGPYYFVLGPGADDADTRVVRSNPDAVRDFLARHLGDDEPLRLPYVNTAVNAGVEGECVNRFLEPFGLHVEDPTPDAMFEVCEGAGVSLTMYDVLGGIVRQFDSPLEGAPDIGAVMHHGHVYPVTNHLPPTLPVGPVERYEHREDTLLRFEQEHALFFRRNNTYFAGPDVVLKPEATGFEPWMQAVLDAFTITTGFDDDVAQSLKSSALPLNFADSSLPDVIPHPDVEYIAYDMTKCYYNTVRRICQIGSMPEPTMFDRWRPVTVDDDEALIEDCAYYRLLPSHMDVIARYGLQTNVVCGPMLRLLIEAHILPSASLLAVASHVVVFPRMKPKKLAAVLAALDANIGSDTGRQKTYAVVNGLMGITRRTDTFWFQVDRRFAAEREYYTRVYEAASHGPDEMTVTREELQTRCRLHWHTHVIQMANHRVLRAALMIKSACGGRDALPVRVKVDSLMYRRRNIRTPFCDVPKVLDQDLWHVEELGPEPLRIYRHAIQRVVPEPSLAGVPYEGNTTYIGPPGTGKTYRALHEHKIDLAVCYSHRGARRVNGTTLHSAWRVWGDDRYPTSVDHLRGLTVFVDEAQAAGSWFWGLFREAYMHAGTRFVFAMDPNQLYPVGEKPLSVIPFCGNVVHLTHDFRNDQSLILLREAVLAGSAEVPVLTKLYDGHLTQLNIAHLNRTCRFVNDLVANLLGQKFGKPGGRYIALATDREHKRFLNAQRLEVDRMGWWHVVGDEIAEPFRLSAAERRRYVGWAYCTTIHKQIGETFTEPYTVWDYGSLYMDKHSLYTAVTRGLSARQVTFRPTPTPACLE